MKTETIILEKTKPNIPWEGCINSVNYRIERGVPVEVPSFLAQFIKECEFEKNRSSSQIRAFTSPGGARLA